VSETKKKNEFLYFALRNGKLKVGLLIVFLFLLIAIFGPLFAKYPLNDFIAGGPNPPSSDYYLGTTALMGRMCTPNSFTAWARPLWSASSVAGWPL